MSGSRKIGVAGSIGSLRAFGEFFIEYLDSQRPSQWLRHCLEDLKPGQTLRLTPQQNQQFCRLQRGRPEFVPEASSSTWFELLVSESSVA